MAADDSAIGPEERIAHWVRDLTAALRGYLLDFSSTPPRIRSDRKIVESTKLDLMDVPEDAF